LLGDDPGVEEAARTLGCRHHSPILRNDRGVPLISDAFRLGQELASRSLVGYVNADIVLLPDLLPVLAALRGRKGPFLLTGRRRNLDVEEDLPFGHDWAAALKRRAECEGQIADEWWLDYFIFPNGSVPAMPPFAIGRAFWDNWLVYDSRCRGVPVIDASADLVVVHQNHDYGHLQDPAAGWRGRESALNRLLLGSRGHAYSLADATHVLRGGRLHRRLSLQPVRRWLGFHAGFRGGRVGD
jgi:hypothetical protein